mmetsp:Transcript_17859/g.8380  ORF Transcript_17859/g.8380 Transcript_17859/m.8380 type:complete len:94 (-) Transcript_17859:12-293(-)
MTIARILIICIMTFKIPMNSFPCRQCILVSFHYETLNAPRWLFLLTTSCILLVSLGLALAIPNIIDVFTILGGGFGVAHAFVYPTILHFKSTR